MSGPVVNGLAQFEDAAREVGIDLELLFAVLVQTHDGQRLWLSNRLYRNPNVTPYVREVQARNQRLWDLLARMRPSWQRENIEFDHAEAIADSLPLAS